MKKNQQKIGFFKVLRVMGGVAITLAIMTPVLLVVALIKRA